MMMLMIQTWNRKFTGFFGKDIGKCRDFYGNTYGFIGNCRDLEEHIYN